MEKANLEPMSDLAKLWEDAVCDYEKRTKKSLRLNHINNMDDAMRSTDSLQKGFGDFRHDHGKIDKVRTVFKNNMWLISKVVNTIQIVGSAAAAFPPAMPATLIFAAFGQVMQSFATQSADYDKIMGFYDFTHRFFDRLSLIQDKTGDVPQLQRCISRVFTSMLTICAVAQDYSTGKSRRLKKWLDTLVDGSDAVLASAYSDMEAAINELSDTVGLATFKTVEVIAGVMSSISQNMEVVVSTITTVDERTGAIQANLEVFTKQSRTAAAQQSEKQDAMDKKLDAIFQVAKESARAADRAQEKERNKMSGKPAKTDPAEKKRNTVNQVKSYFKAWVVDWDTMCKDTKKQNREIKDLVTADTGQWLLKQEDEYTKWMNNEGSPILWLRGAAGVGKTFLAHIAATDLEAKSKDRSFEAHFYFRESQHTLGSWRAALSCLAFQIAEKDPKYCEQLASELANLTNPPAWAELFSGRFPGKDEGHAFLVLDGIDEMKEDERDLMHQDLAEIAEKGLNIRVLLASRPDVTQVATLNPVIVEVTAEKLATDFSKVINAGCKSLSRLKKFRRATKIIIVKKLKAKADGMRYIEHMLRRLSFIGREKAVLQDLQTKLPDNLNALYALMLEECQRGRTDRQYQALKKMFAWIAYSARSLTLAEASKLAQLTVADDHAFDIEDELIGRSARILDIRAERFDEDEWDEESEERENSDTETETGLDTSDHGGASLTFQERSLREYFQAIDVDENGLRTPPSTAHLTIFEMAASFLFLDCDRLQYGQQDDLRQYAADYWVHHFVEIDLDTIEEDDLVRVTTILHKILSGFGNTARNMEYFSTSVYEELVSSNTSLLDRLKLWTDRASKLRDGALPTDVQTWVRSFTAPGALLTLGRAHVSNWFTEYHSFPSYAAYRFARAALAMCEVDVAEGTAETVLKVANHFSDIPHTAGTMRAISVVILTDFNDQNEQALEYVQKGMEMLESGDETLRFYLTRSTSLLHADMQKYEEAIAAVDTALSALPTDWKKDSNLTDTIEYIYIEKAEYLKALKRPDDAIEVYNELRILNPDKPFTGTRLDDISLLVDSNTDPSGEKLFKLLQSWTDEERLKYFQYNFDFKDDFTTNRLSKVISLPGDEPRALVFQCFDKLMESVKQHPQQLVFPRIALASIYKDVLNDPAKARTLYTQVLKTEIQDYDMFTLDNTLSEARRTLGELIFCEFQKTTKPAEKQALLVEFKDLIKNVQRPDEVTSDASNLSVMLALMTKVLGPATEYQEIMHKAFDICVEGLEDTVGWNDTSSFRLLAKLLACVKGLERDALIALSCQFSKVTEEPEEEDASSGEEDTTSTKSADESPKEEVEKTEDDAQSNTGHVTLTETTISSTATIDGVVKDKSTVIIEEVVVDANDQTSNEDATPDTVVVDAAEGDQTPAQPDPHTLPAIEDEDLISTATWCNGCDKQWDHWENPIYLCLMCESMDLCVACHEKRMLQNQGQANTSWKNFCAPNHCYVRGPIKGWQGVKDGSIRIQDEEGNVVATPFKEWLKGLKEERWAEAWEQFWVDMPGIQSIGM